MLNFFDLPRKLIRRAYDMPLVNWIQIGLNTDLLDEAVEKIRTNRPLKELARIHPTNRAYLNKILREEITKQFSGDNGSNNRPMLEIMLNAIDERPDDAESYDVCAKVRSSKFICDDPGKSMDLEGILKFLIIPFSTEKTGLEEIGKFGVGFLSAFNYCIKEGAVVRVDTNNGQEGCSVYFSTKTPDVEGLRMLLKLTGKKNKGTRVKVYKSIDNVKALKAYLSNHLSGIPNFKANIFINRQQANQTDENWYAENVELDVRGRKIRQKLGLKVYDHTSEGKTRSINLTSQGVLVKLYGTDHPGCVVAFPAAVQVVEGRDEFKIDYNYRTCKDAVFKTLEQYIRAKIPSEKDDKATKTRKTYIMNDMDTLITSLLSALEIRKLGDIPNIHAIKDLLFPGKKYVISTAFHERMHPFIGDTLDQHAATLSSQGCSYWREFFGGNKELMDDLMRPAISAKPKDLMVVYEHHQHFHPNLHFVLNRMLPGKIQKIKFVDIKPAGERVFHVEEPDTYNYQLYINMSHPLLKESKFNPVIAYELASRFTDEIFDSCDMPMSDEGTESKVCEKISTLANPLDQFYTMRQE